jgi:hypothetical protein
MRARALITNPPKAGRPMWACACKTMFCKGAATPVWFSILARKVIRRGNFISVEDLCDKINKFIDYFNEMMAKPFRWTYQGKPLEA